MCPDWIASIKVALIDSMTRLASIVVGGNSDVGQRVENLIPTAMNGLIFLYRSLNLEGPFRDLYDSMKFDSKYSLNMVWSEVVLLMSSRSDAIGRTFGLVDRVLTDSDDVASEDGGGVGVTGRLTNTEGGVGMVFSVINWDVHLVLNS